VNHPPVVRQRGRKLQERRARFLRANPLCQSCLKANRLRPACEVDHVIALVNGGADDFTTNGQALCKPCHREKTARDLGYRARPQVGLDGYPVGTQWKP